MLAAMLGGAESPPAIYPIPRASPTSGMDGAEALCSDPACTTSASCTATHSAADFISALSEAGDATRSAHLGPPPACSSRAREALHGARGGSARGLRRPGSPPTSQARPHSAYSAQFQPDLDDVQGILRTAPASPRQLGDLRSRPGIVRRPPAPATIIADFPAATDMLDVMAPSLPPEVGTLLPRLHEGRPASARPSPQSTTMPPPHDAKTGTGAGNGTGSGIGARCPDPRFDLRPTATQQEPQQRRGSPRRPRTVPTAPRAPQPGGLQVMSRPSTSGNGISPRAASILPVGAAGASDDLGGDIGAGGSGSGMADGSAVAGVRRATPPPPTASGTDGWPPVPAEEATRSAHPSGVPPTAHRMVAVAAPSVALRSRPSSRPVSQPAVAATQQVMREQQQKHTELRQQQEQRSAHAGPTRKMSTLLGAPVPLTPRADESELNEIPPRLLAAAATGLLPGVKIGSYVFSSDMRALLAKKWEQFTRTAEAPTEALAIPMPASARAGSAALEKMKVGHAKLVQQGAQRPITAAAWQPSPRQQKLSRPGMAQSARGPDAAPRPMSPRRAQTQGGPASAAPVSCTASEHMVSTSPWHANY